MSKNKINEGLIDKAISSIFTSIGKGARKQALKFAEKFMDEGKEVYLVELEGKDPSEMGFNYFTNLIQKTLPLSQYDLMEKKLQLIWVRKKLI